MSLPKELEAKAYDPDGHEARKFGWLEHKVVSVSDLEAFFDGELMPCPECGGAGYTFIEKRFGAGAENAIPCPNCGCWDPEHFGHDDHRPIAFVDEGEIAEVCAELSPPPLLADKHGEKYRHVWKREP